MKLEDLELASDTHSSGLRVVVARMPGLHRVVLNAQLRTGPAFEPAERNGLSHFLEHMLYRGSPSHPTAHDQAEAFEQLGGSLVATTYVDHGSMAVAVPPRSVADVLALFGEAFQSPVFSGIEIEKGIVREELLEDLDEDGRLVSSDELIRGLCFEGHPLGQPIVGTMDHLEAFDVAALERHHRALYVGRNTVLCIAGPVDPEQVMRAAERVFAALPAGTPPEAPALAAQAGPRFRYVEHAGSQTELRLAYRAPAELDALEPATELLLRVVDDGMSTRLYHRICDQLGLCYDVSAGYEAHAGGGIFDLAADVTAERAAQVLGELLALTRDLRDAGPTEQELDKAKARLAWHFDSMLDDPAEIAAFVASGVLTGVALTPTARHEQLSAVTREQVREAAERMFRPESTSVIAVGDAKRRGRQALREVVLSQT